MIPGHVQRGGAPTTVDRLFAAQCGQRAVAALIEGRHEIMIGEQCGRITEVPLSEALEGPRQIDRELYDLAMTLG